MITVLDGVDLLVFTGGIGEHDAAVRAGICEGLGWIGIALNERRNEAGGVINASGSRCAVRVMASDEDERIARHAWRLVEQA
jgi:acetate kinase